MDVLPPLDGAELSFVFIFGFLVALWSRRVFAGPAVFLLLQYGAVWPLFMLGGRTDDITVFLLAHAAAVWCGSVSGVCVGAILGSSRLLHRREASPKPMAIHAALLVAMALPVWLYTALRGVLPPPWPGVAGILGSVASDVGARFVWIRGAMFIYFPMVSNVRWFVVATGMVKATVLLLFCGIDYVGDLLLPDDPHTSLALRGIAIATVTLVLVVVRISPCYSRIREERMRMSLAPYHLGTAYFTPSPSESSEGEDEKSDDDYVEYSQRQPAINIRDD